MTILLTSPSAVAPGGIVNGALVSTLTALATAGLPVGVISNNPEPTWFKTAFQDDNVTFIHRVGRQDGSAIKAVSQKFNKPTHNFIVLGASEGDVQMAKNGGAVLLAAKWAADTRVAGWGIAVTTPAELNDVIGLVISWPGSWYFEGIEPRYAVRALTDVSSKYVEAEQAMFARNVVNTVKAGGPRLLALLVVAARSLLMSETATQDELMWGVYPSSASSNNDNETLSDFTHRLRTVVSRVRLAKRGAPLLIRHTPSPKRSSGGGGDRTDPSGQIETIHLNPAYRKNVKGRNVVIIDDCTTYGVSFGVAAGLLRTAGAATVTCVALGKFGDQLRYYEIDVKADPFAPISRGQYQFSTARRLLGSVNASAQAALRHLIQ